MSENKGSRNKIIIQRMRANISKTEANGNDFTMIFILLSIFKQ